MISIQSTAATALCFVSVFATAAIGQTSTGDTLPFRKGQWGIEFPLRDYYGLGLLRFSSPRSALLLDGRFGLNGGEQEDDGSGYNQASHQQYVNLRAGRRVYRPLAARAASYITAGVFSSVARSVSEGSYGGPFEKSVSSDWSLGVFGQLGGNYFVTPHLSLGMSVGPGASYSRGRRETTSAGVMRRSRSQSYSVGFGTGSILGTIYF